MREDLSRIVASLISNIGGAQVSTGAQYTVHDNRDVMIDVAKSTCEGLEVLKEKWPELTVNEKEEIAAVILALNTTYSYDEKSKTK